MSRAGKKNMRLFTALSMVYALSAITAFEARADHYVAQNGQAPVSPYSSPATAASNIQDAVNAAVADATVWVDGGIYTFSDSSVGLNVVRIEKPLTLQSLNGSAATVIDGEGEYRCISIVISPGSTQDLVVIDGFTITNGHYKCNGTYCGGAGIYLGPKKGSAIVRNCTITGNVLQNDTDGAVTYSGGAGILCYEGDLTPVISNCAVVGNHTLTGDGGKNVDGGGLFFRTQGLIIDSYFAHNSSVGGGGGMSFGSPLSIVDRCMIISNQSVGNGGGIYINQGGGEIRNSLIAYNTKHNAVGNYSYRMFNCTVVGSGSYGVHLSGNVTAGYLENNIIDKISFGGTGLPISGYNNCLPSEPTSVAVAWENTLVHGGNMSFIKFVDSAAGNFRLQPDSPCVNAGINQQDWLAEALDLDRQSRIDRFSYQPDIGCYEFLPQGIFFRLR